MVEETNISPDIEEEEQVSDENEEEIEETLTPNQTIQLLGERLEEFEFYGNQIEFNKQLFKGFKIFLDKLTNIEEKITSIEEKLNGKA